MSKRRRPGQPSKYQETFCDDVVEAMSSGLSLSAFAGIAGVSRETVYQWTKAHPEFLEAVQRGRAARILFLERKLLSAGLGPQCTAAIFALKNAAPDEWRDVQKQEVVVADGGKLSIETMTKEQLTEELGRRGIFLPTVSKTRYPPRRD